MKYFIPTLAGLGIVVVVSKELRWLQGGLVVMRLEGLKRDLGLNLAG